MTPPPPPARAHARPTMEEMRDRIIDMMLHRQWNPGVSHKELAAEWECAPRTVADRALEASRVLHHAARGDVQEWAAEAIAELDSMQASAMALEKVVCVGKDEETKQLIFERVPQPDVKAAVACMKLKAEIKGAMAPVKRQEVAPDEVSKMTREQKLAEHRKAIAELEAEAQQKGDEVH